MYYARIKKNGKDKWQSLKTKLLSVAKHRLLEFQKLHLEVKTIASGDEARMTVGQMMTERENHIRENPDIKPRTKEFYIEIHEAICANWKGIKNKEIRTITEAQCLKFVNKMKAKFSWNRTNQIIRALKDLFKRANKKAIMFTNPMEQEDITFQTYKKKKKDLPTTQQIEELAREVERVVGRGGKARGELIRFMAYTGLRSMSEYKWVTWGDVDFKSNFLIVRGHPETGTKNDRGMRKRDEGEYSRKIPLHKKLRALLRDMRKNRKDEPLNQRVLKVLECQKSIDRASAELGIPRLTPSGFRSFYTTECLNQGIDIGTLANWRGDSDKGETLLKWYYGQRDEVSQEAAKTLDF